MKEVDMMFGYKGHFSMHVDYTKYGKPVAMLLMDWEQTTNQGFNFAQVVFDTMRKATKAKRSKSMPGVWHTDGVNVRFAYREQDDIQNIYLHMECPALKQLAIERGLPSTNVTTIAENGKLKNADRYWWKWKAAYQRQGALSFFLIAHAIDARPSQIQWGTPILAIRNLDFMEITSWEKVATLTEEGREDVQMLGDVWGMVDRAIRNKFIRE
jgi:hypothetical protein